MQMDVGLIDWKLNDDWSKYFIAYIIDRYREKQVKSQDSSLYLGGCLYVCVRAFLHPIDNKFRYMDINTYYFLIHKQIDINLFMHLNMYMTVVHFPCIANMISMICIIIGYQNIAILIKKVINVMTS